jgi:hypothetical protein
MVRIISPRPVPGRRTFIGVEFIDGVAEVGPLHPERELALLQHGYTIVHPDVMAPGSFTGTVADVHFADSLADDPLAPFEALPEAIEGDTTPKISRRKKG